MFDNIKKIVGIKQKKGVRSPTLDTVIMVDEFIKGKSLDEAKQVNEEVLVDS